MKIAAFDIETTGLLASDHRIIEVYAGLWDSDTGAQLDAYETRINPQRSISAEAERVHHISLPMLAGAPIFSTIAEDLRAFLTRGDLLVAHNGAGFDLPFVNQDLRRAGLAEIHIPMFDTFLSARWATPIGKAPNLAELCFACDVDYDPALAHAADYDVRVMADCLFRGLKWNFFTLPSIESESHRLAA